MAKKTTAKQTTTKKRATAPAAVTSGSTISRSTTNGGPVFAQPDHSPDPTAFRTQHDTKGDDAAYKILDKEGKSEPPLPFPPSRGGTEPILKLEDILGSQGSAIVSAITSRNQIVFHALGDTGNTRSVKSQNAVTDKLDTDFQESSPADIPSFLLHLGDIVYSFGEGQYYYDQFYEPYRDYPRPIIALAGNHDGMVAPGSSTPSLQAFLNNFCTKTPTTSPDAGGLRRTTMVQPGVYYTFEAPLVRILALYSNRLEDPGIISSEGRTHAGISDLQLGFLKAALTRIDSEKFAGAVIIAVHHPPFTTGKHGGSPVMLKEIDTICEETGVWPHAVLSGHAHSYQRYTRTTGGMQIPYLIAGNGGHGLTPLVRKGSPALRVPSALTTAAGVTFENYDDQDYGYLRVLVTAQQLRIEYHPAPDGAEAKTPDDAVTVDLKSRKLVHFNAAAA